ncbi:MAG: hypothetical protein AAF193_00850, partial [Bacteroidota bacterium]
MCSTHVTSMNKKKASHSWTRELYALSSDDVMGCSDADGIVKVVSTPFNNQILESKRTQDL